MATFNYKTRGMSLPHKKQKVYFCCHPEDLAFSLEKISEEILEQYNCAVWYDEKPEESYEKEELEAYLCQMQLFVIPVTRKFLETENRAKDVEFAYAKEHHIPILPLMQEWNLCSLFNEVCGQIQYLDPFERDQSAIGYKEKFTKFLASVLVGEKLADQIREAFDGYIFLSYRKKDRRYANQMMRLIHSYSICRDVAIWYDEYLIPGENFQEGIEGYLKKAHVFAMVVTPNLICEENYVMSVEYPMAVKEGKHIFPVMWKDTDEFELYEKYEDIPDVISHQNDRKFEKKINQFFKDKVKKEEKDQPKQLYYIGLAYLNGIDMEVNYERALRLIREAALKEYEPAIEKLAEMYRFGNGVERDYKEAASWQEKLVEVQEKGLTTGTTMSLENVFDIIKNLLILAEDHSIIWQPDKMKVYYEKVRHYTSNIKDASGGETFRLIYILACQSLGELYVKEEDCPNGEKYFLEALTEGEDMLKKGGDEVLIHHVMSSLELSYRYAGSLYKILGDEEKEKAYYEKSFEILNKFEGAFSTTESAQRLCRNYMHQEEECRKKNDLAGAKECCIKSMELLKQAAKEDKKAGIIKDLLWTYIRYGNLLQEEKAYEEADAAYETAFSYAKKNEEETATFDSVLDFMNVCRHIATARKDRGDEAGARVYGLLGMHRAKKIYGAVQKTEYKKLFFQLCGFVLGTFDVIIKEDEEKGLKRCLQEFTWKMMIRWEEHKTETNGSQLAALYCINGWIDELEGKNNQKYLEDACEIWETCGELSGEKILNDYWHSSEESPSNKGPYGRLIDMIKTEVHIDWELHDMLKRMKRWQEPKEHEDLFGSCAKEEKEDKEDKEEKEEEDDWYYDNWGYWGYEEEMDDKAYREKLKQEKTEKRKAEKQLKESRKKKIKKQIEKKGLAAYLKGLFS